MSFLLSFLSEVGEEHSRDVENRDAYMGGCLACLQFPSHRLYTFGKGIKNQPKNMATYPHGRDHTSRIAPNKCDVGALKPVYMVIQFQQNTERRTLTP
jgi:hypothetical protein